MLELGPSVSVFAEYRRTSTSHSDAEAVLGCSQMHTDCSETARTPNYRSHNLHRDEGSIGRLRVSWQNLRSQSGSGTPSTVQRFG